MSRTFTNLLTHLIFSTKNREPLIVPEVKSELYAYLGGLTKELRGKAYGINGDADHVHMLVNLPPVVSISDALRFIKCNSSGWIHDKWPRREFSWQPGYGAFSVSKSNVGGVLEYISKQEMHHERSRMSMSTSCGSMRSCMTNATSDIDHVARVRGLI